MQNIETKNSEFYDKKWEDQWNFAREYYGPIFYHRRRLIQKIIKNYRLKGKILDVGCGDGSLLSLFRENTNELYGSDISEKGVQLAKSKFGDIATFAVGDITDLSSLIDGEFDVVICSEVLEHIENDELALQNLYHTLKRGGYLIISTQVRKKYWSIRDELDGHVRRYEKEELETKIMKNGFIICESWSWGYPIYHLYNKIILKNVQDQTVIKIAKKSKLKRIFSIILRSIFYLDDFFIHNSKGRTIFLVAKKQRVRIVNGEKIVSTPNSERYC